MLQRKVSRRKFRDNLAAGLVFPFIGMIRRFSRSTRKDIAYAIARLIFAVSSKTRLRAIDNVARAFPFISHAEARLLALNSYKNIVFGVFECFWLEEIPYQLHISEDVKCILQSGKGAVVATMHMACYEIVPFVVQKQTQRSTTMSKIPAFIPDGLSVYEQSGIECIPKGDSSGFLKLIKSAKRGAVVSLHSDHYAEDTNVIFFGRKTKAPCGAAMLSALVKSPLLLAYGVLDHNEVYQIYFECIEPEYVAPQHNGVEWSTREIYRRFEQTILQFPEQWYWSYNRWR